jgi:hypothetical protein
VTDVERLIGHHADTNLRWDTMRYPAEFSTISVGPRRRRMPRSRQLSGCRGWLTRTSLPQALAGADATSCTIVVTTPVDDVWTAHRDRAGWRLQRRDTDRPDARVTLDPDTLWRVTTRGLQPAAAMAKALVVGDTGLAATALELVSIIR